MLKAIPKLSAEVNLDNGLFMESNDASASHAERSLNREPPFVARGISEIYQMSEVQVQVHTLRSKSGLEEGAEVIVHPSNQTNDGVRVERAVSSRNENPIQPRRFLHVQIPQFRMSLDIDLASL